MQRVDNFHVLRIIFHVLVLIVYSLLVAVLICLYFKVGETPSLPPAVCATGMHIFQGGKTSKTSNATDLVQCLNVAHVDLHSEYHKKFSYIERYQINYRYWPLSAK